MTTSDPGLDDRQLLRSDLVLLDEPSQTDEAVLRTLSALLKMHGLVHASHADATVTRERAYPTGLELGTVNVALPHSDAEHVIKNAIAVAVMRAPVDFHHMADLERVTKVHVVLMLAISEKEAMVPLLARLALVLQDGTTLAAIAGSQTPAGAISALRDGLAAAGESTT